VVAGVISSFRQLDPKLWKMTINLPCTIFY
jgi:hypothetical protein